MVIDCLLACCSSSAGGLAVRFISQGRCQVSVTPQTVVFIVFLIMRQARKSGFPDFRKISVRGFGRMWGVPVEPERREQLRLHSRFAEVMCLVRANPTLFML